MYLVIMLTFCIVNYYGYLYQKNQKDRDILNDNQVIVIGIISSFLMISSIGYNNISGFQMVEDVIYFKSKELSICMDSMDRYLSDNKGQTVKINNCPSTTSSLHYQPLANGFWATDAIMEYYNVDIIMEDSNED